MMETRTSSLPDTVVIITADITDDVLTVGVKTS